MQRLSPDKIERSPEISSWLSQFTSDRRPMAEVLLHHLRFVSRDEYSGWLHSSLDRLNGAGPFALFAVRKLKKSNGQISPFFDSTGIPKTRPPTAQGSEDLVYSLIGNAAREKSSSFLDHPGIEEMRAKRVHDLVLIDDSIGSGRRVSEFLESMMCSKTLLSWWSYGLIRFHILSYARTREGEKSIIENMVGSNHPRRKYPKSQKISFSSEHVYSSMDLESRWGDDYKNILDLCDSVTEVPKGYRRGYGSVMANLVFYHSVPNNMPGILYFRSGKWKPLFPGRTLPSWTIELLEDDEERAAGEAWSRLGESMVELLGLAKSGVRNPRIIEQRMGRDRDYVMELIQRAKYLGLLNDGGRITRSGIDAYYSNIREKPQREYDHSLYLPRSWCAGQETVQPSRG